MKKSQLSLFVVAGIVVALFIAIIFLNSNTYVKNQAAVIINTDNNNLIQYAEACHKETLIKALDSVNYSNKTELEDYIENNIINCIDLSLFPDYDITFDKPLSNIVIINDEIEDNLKFQIYINGEKIGKSDFQLSITAPATKGQNLIPGCESGMPGCGQTENNNNEESCTGACTTGGNDEGCNDFSGYSFNFNCMTKGMCKKTFPYGNEACDGKTLTYGKFKDFGSNYPDCIVIHYTESSDYSNTVQFLAVASDRSVQYVLGRDCELAQLLPDSYTAVHAGCIGEYCAKSCPVCTYEETTKSIVGANIRCIGIEVMNLGSACSDPTMNPKNYPCVKINNNLLESYPDKQMNCLADLVAYLIRKNNIPFDRGHIVGHEEITAKSDPGPAFNWESFMGLVGARLG